MCLHTIPEITTVALPVILVSVRALRMSAKFKQKIVTNNEKIYKKLILDHL